MPASTVSKLARIVFLLSLLPALAKAGAPPSPNKADGHGNVQTRGPHGWHHNAAMSAMLQQQIMSTQQAIQAWNTALRLATQNPMDDWRRKEVQKSYEHMNEAVNRLEADFKNGKYESGLEAVQKTLATAVDPKAVDKTGSAEGVAKAETELLSGERAANEYDGRNGNEGAHPPGAGAFIAQNKELINLQIEENGEKAGEKGASLSDGKAPSAAAGVEPGTALGVGYPLHEGGLAELQEALSIDKELPRSALPGDTDGSDAHRLRGRNNDEDSATDAEGAARASESPDNASAGDSAIGTWATRWFGPQYGPRLASLMAPATRIFGKGWTGVNGGHRRRGKQRDLLSDGDTEDWGGAIMRWLILPALMALLLWAAIGFRFLNPRLVMRAARGRAVPSPAQAIPQPSFAPSAEERTVEEILPEHTNPQALRQAVWLDQELGKWILVKIDRMGNILETAGILLAGTVVASTLLNGKSSAQRLKLGADGLWSPCTEPEQLLFSKA